MQARRPVVFDLDGVLIDSEDLAWEAWRRVLARYSGVVTADDIARLTGQTEYDAYVYYSATLPLPPFDEFWRDIAEATYTLFDERLEAFDDAVDTLEVLVGRGHPLAVASSSPRERVDRSLASVGLAGRFDFIVAGDEIRAGKPAPDIFLAAAAGLGCDPAECVAVEDSPAGIQSAKAAGMWVIAVQRGLFPDNELGEADLVVPRLTPAPFLA